MISGRLINLRSIEASDLQNWVKWFNDSDITEYLARIYPYGTGEAERYWQQTQQKADEVLYSIATQRENRHIGSAGLRHIDWRSRNAELSILIGAKELWGKGYGTDATHALCRFAFKEMGLNRVYLYVRQDHLGGVEAYRRSGFKQEGIARQQLYRNGAFHDLVLMGMLAEELES